MIVEITSTLEQFSTHLTSIALDLGGILEGSWRDLGGDLGRDLGGDLGRDLGGDLGVELGGNLGGDLAASMK